MPHSRQDVGMCNPLNTPIISMSMAPPTTLATESVNASTDCKANLPKGNAVAHTAPWQMPQNSFHSICH